MTTHLPLEMIHPGELMPVTVIGITQNGAIVQIDKTEYTAFIHISKIAKGYVREVSDYISIGDKLDAMGSNKGFKPELIFTHLELKPKHHDTPVRSQKEYKSKPAPEQYTPKQHIPKSLDDMIADADKSFKDKYSSREKKQNHGRRNASRKKS